MISPMNPILPSGRPSTRSRCRPLALALVWALALGAPAWPEAPPSSSPAGVGHSVGHSFGQSLHPTLPSEPASLTLAEAEVQALEGHHRLAASRFSAEAAGQRVGQSASSLYPTLTATSSYSHTDVFGPDANSATVVTTPGAGTNIPVVVTGGSQRSGARKSLNAGLTARQTLLDFTRPHQLEQARQNELVALAELDGIRQDVLLEVRKAWLTAFIDQTILEIRRETVANREARLAQAQAFYKQGTKARIEVATAEADLAQARLEALKAETQLQVDWVALNVAMGRTSPSPYRLELDPEWDRIPELDSERMLEVALARRPELVALQARLRNQLASLRALGAESLPTLSANATLQGSGSPTPLDGTWTLGVSLNWSLFDGFLRQYRDGEARATARALAEQFEQQRIAVYQEVTSRLVQVRQATEQIQAAQASLEAARESHRLASARYRVGVGSSLELSDAELALSQARTDLAGAANALRTSRAELSRALGIEDLADLPEPAAPLELDPLPGFKPERSAP